jgi:hypothetical protein
LNPANHTWHFLTQQHQRTVPLNHGDVTL